MAKYRYRCIQPRRRKGIVYRRGLDYEFEAPLTPAFARYFELLSEPKPKKKAAPKKVDKPAEPEVDIEVTITPEQE